MHRSVGTIITFVLCIVSTTISAQALREADGFFARSLSIGDDSPGTQAELGFTVNFFGIERSAAFVNNNGNITFDERLLTFTPFDLTATNREIIAPYFGDVDTSAAGRVFYGNAMLNDRMAFAATWSGVGYFSDGTNRLNTFQVVLIERSDVAPGDFDIEFNYDQVQWETGDASGGVNGLGGSSARAGYSNGTGDPGTSFELPGSGVNGALLDNNSATGLTANSLNSEVSGRYVFFARAGAITPIESDGVAVDDYFTVSDLGPRTLNVLANDLGNIAISSVEQPPHGSVELENNKVIYTPEPGFVGRFSFSYQGLDVGGNGSTATVTVTAVDVDLIPDFETGQCTNESLPATWVDLLAAGRASAMDLAGERFVVNRLDVDRELFLYDVATRGGLQLTEDSPAQAGPRFLAFIEGTQEALIQTGDRQITGQMTTDEGRGDPSPWIINLDTRETRPVPSSFRNAVLSRSGTYFGQTQATSVNGRYLVVEEYELLAPPVRNTDLVAVARRLALLDVRGEIEVDLEAAMRTATGIEDFVIPGAPLRHVISGDGRFYGHDSPYLIDGVDGQVSATPSLPFLTELSAEQNRIGLISQFALLDLANLTVTQPLVPDLGAFAQRAEDFRFSSRFNFVRRLGQSGTKVLNDRPLPIIGVDNPEQNGDIVLSIDGGPPSALTDTPNALNGFLFSPGLAYITPDEDWVVFAAYQDLTGDNGDRNQELFRMNLDTQSISQMTQSFDPLSTLLQQLDLSLTEFGFIDQLDPVNMSASGDRILARSTRPAGIADDNGNQSFYGFGSNRQGPSLQLIDCRG